MHQLLAASRIRRMPITKAIAEETLAEMLHRTGQPVEFQQIEKAVCDVFGIKQQSLQCSRRLKALNAPRMIAMWLARKHTRAALNEIGRYFGRRSHSTVISADKAVGRWVAEHVELHWPIKSATPKTRSGKSRPSFRGLAWTIQGGWDVRMFMVGLRNRRASIEHCDLANRPTFTRRPTKAMLPLSHPTDGGN